MDVRAALLRAVAARPRVLLVQTSGGTRARLAAERELRRRDLPEALTPADADILLAAGPVCPSLEAALDRLWNDMPAPRALARARTAEEITAVLDASCRSLAEGGAPPDASGGHGDQDHGDQGGNMEMPAGLPMAEPGQDRDGLTLDQLHVRFGPFLPHWPAGLTLRLTLQGDVVQHVEDETAAGHGPLGPEASHGPVAAAPFWTGPWLRAAAGEDVSVGAAARRRAAAHLDSLGRFLAVAGLPSAATPARCLRDDVLAGARHGDIRTRAERLARRVGRSRPLLWLTRGMGDLSHAEAEAAGLSGPAARAGGDVPARYRQWLTAIEEDLARMDDTRPLDPSAFDTARGRFDPSCPPSCALVQVLTRMLEGAEVAAARLIVASVDPDPGEFAARLSETARG